VPSIRRQIWPPDVLLGAPSNFKKKKKKYYFDDHGIMLNIHALEIRIE
jgi:hypothetical protein